MDRAFPGALQPLPAQVTGKRIELEHSGDKEKYDFKLCSKLIHPTALMLIHPETTTSNQVNKEYLAVEVLFYAWLIVSLFHEIAWHD